MIDANANPERRAGFGVFRNAPAPHLPPDGHGGVTDKFIKGAIIRVPVV